MQNPKPVHINIPPALCTALLLTLPISFLPLPILSLFSSPSFSPHRTDFSVWMLGYVFALRAAVCHIPHTYAIHTPR